MKYCVGCCELENQRVIFVVEVEKVDSEETVIWLYRATLITKEMGFTSHRLLKM